MNLQDELNLVACDWLPKCESGFESYSINYNTEDLQLVPKTKEAFGLNMPICKREEVKNEGLSWDGDVHFRTLISMREAQEFIREPKELLKWFNIQTYEFKKALKSVYPDTYNLDITYTRPNKTDFFHLLENANAFEFRIFVEKK